MTRILVCVVMLATAIGLTLSAAGPGYTNPPAPPQPGPVQATVPYTAAVYNGPGMTADQAKRLIALLESVDGKLDALTAIDERLAAMEGKLGGAATPAAAPKATWQQVTVAKCAACHNETTHKADLILVTSEGKAKPLNGAEWASVTKAVLNEHMPPGKPLGEAEKTPFRAPSAKGAEKAAPKGKK